MAVMPGEKTKLQVKITSTFTDIGSVTEISGPEMEVAKVEKTTLASTLHEYRPSGIVEMGELTFTILYNADDTTTHSELLAGFYAKTVFDWKLIFNSGDVVPANRTFSGFLTKFPMDGMKVEENVSAQLSICLTTVTTDTAGAAS